MRLRCLAVLTLALLLAWLPGHARAVDLPRTTGMARPQAVPSYFGTLEIRRGNLAPFPKWTRVLAQHEKDLKAGAGNCTPAADHPCPWEEWTQFLDSIRDRDLRGQIGAVNRYMNSHPYILDIVNWGVEDYWETPREFLRLSGDCEDFAIAKMMSLRRLGHTDTDMRIVVLQDLNLHIGHAVLVVKVDGENLVLDNQIPQVVAASSIHHYRPIYSVNEHYWWFHRQLH